jgi:ATP-binding cassette subfamily C protein/ATP-binding cassette subfamily C protein EexD
MMVQAALRNGDAVRGLGMGDIVLDRWAGAQSALVAVHAEASERSSALVAVSKFTRMAVQAALLCAGAWLSIEQQISSGSIMAASIVMARALAPIEQTVAQWKRVVACRAAYFRLKQLFQSTPAPRAGVSLPRPAGHLEADGIVVWPLGGNRPTVKGVSFSIQPGETVAVVGASGAGKSSLIKALAGVWPVKGGSVRIDGADYTQWDGIKLGKNIGYLPQDIELFSGTVAENIARLGEADDQAVIAAAKLAGAHEVILRLPNGYDTPIGESGLALSGGMRQRVGLARAIYGNPALVILDEPNSNLDDEGDRALAKALANLKAEKRTVVVVTHRPTVLASCDKMLVMAFGQVLAFGQRDDVLSRMRGNRVAAVSPSDPSRRPVENHANGATPIRPDVGRIAANAS